MFRVDEQGASSEGRVQKESCYGGVRVAGQEDGRAAA